MICYLKQEYELSTTQCIDRCDGFNATCDDYISMRTMKTLYDNRDTLRNEDESRLEELLSKDTNWKDPSTWSRKLRQYVRNYRLRKNKIE